MIVRRPLLVANPNAGLYYRKNDFLALRAAFVRRYPEGKVLLSLPDSDAGHLFSNHTDCDLLVIYGGDGTVHRLIQLGPPPDLPILVLPGGTGNVLSQYLGTSIFSGSSEAVWPLLHTARPITIRPGLAGDRRFIVMAGAGWDGQALRYISGKKVIGSLAYYKAGLQALLSRDLPEFSITLTLADGRNLDLNQVRWCLGSRIPPYLGILRTPMDDLPLERTLHVTIVQGSRLKILSTFAGFLPGIRDLLTPHSFQVRTVFFHSSLSHKKLAFQADGEAIPPASTMTVSPETLTFLAFS